MSSTALKVSAAFSASVREAAEAADRSMTGQVEHWGKLGRAAERVLPAQVAAALKQCGGDLDAAEDPALRRRVLEALAAVTAGQGAGETTRYLQSLGQPLFEADPYDPGKILRILPDGTRQRGRMGSRGFQPDP